MGDDLTVANTPFFDIEEEYFVKIDLWPLGNVAITLMDFFFGIAGNVVQAGRTVMDFRPDLQRTIQGMAAENNDILAEMKASERYQRAMQKIAQRSAAGSSA